MSRLAFYHLDSINIMAGSLSLNTQFERKKNVKAGSITGGVALGLILLFILIKWPLPSITPVPTEELVEVNLGSSDVGSGDDQPLLPGSPAEAQEPAYTPPQPVQQQTEEAVKDVDTDDRPENIDAPAIKRPTVAKPAATKINTESKVEKTPNTTATPAPAPQAPPRPRAVMGRTMGGTGNGGNGAETYKPGTGEGSGNGTGDQGVAGGSPNGRSYNGAPKNFGTRVMSLAAQNFEDDFDRNAKIAMEVVVNEAGKVVSATYTSRGSTGTATAQMKEIARRRAFELKFGNAEGGQKGIVVFNFQVRN